MAFIATFGNRSLANDNLEKVIFYKQKELVEITDDEDNHVVVLSPLQKKLSYYFGAVKEKDRDKINT